MDILRGVPSDLTQCLYSVARAPSSVVLRVRHWSCLALVRQLGQGRELSNVKTLEILKR